MSAWWSAENDAALLMAMVEVAYTDPCNGSFMSQAIEELGEE